MHHARTPSLVPFLLVAVIAPGCGSEDAGLSYHAFVCDEPGPVRLLHAPETVGGWVVGRVGERVVVSIEDEQGQTRAHAVGLCGEDPVALELADEVARWGDGLFSRRKDSGDMEYHDAHTGEHHRVFADVHPLFFSTSQGTLALGRNGGPLLLHPDPTDSAAEPVTLLPATMDFESSDYGPHEELFSDGTHTFALDPAGSLLRIELSTGAQEPLVDDVYRFRMVDGGAQVLYSNGANEVLLRNLTTGEETVLGDTFVEDSSGHGYLHVSEAHGWIAVGYGTLVHLGRHEVLAERGHSLHPAEDGRAFLVRESSDRIEDEVFGLLPPLDVWLLDDDGSFELLAETTCAATSALGATIETFHPNGVAIDRSCLSDTAPGEPGDVVFYPIEGEPYVAGRNFGEAWLMSGHVLSIEHVATFGGARWSGRLLVDPIDGPAAVVAHDVVALAAPTDDDVDYLVAGQGLHRATLDLD